MDSVVLLDSEIHIEDILFIFWDEFKENHTVGENTSKWLHSSVWNDDFLIKVHYILAFEKKNWT